MEAMQVVERVELEEGTPACQLHFAQRIDLRDALAQAQSELVSEPLGAASSGEVAFPW